MLDLFARTLVHRGRTLCHLSSDFIGYNNSGHEGNGQSNWIAMVKCYIHHTCGRKVRTKSAAFAIEGAPDSSETVSMGRLRTIAVIRIKTCRCGLTEATD